MKRLFLLANVCVLPACAQTFPGTAALDQTIDHAIREDKIPGAVLIVGHQGRILHRKAYGNRSLVPEKKPMTVETIFDCASLTKVVATTSAIAKLVETGKVRLNDRVTEYLPEYQGGKSGVTIRNLLTHFSGLRPDVDLKPEWSGYETGVKLALIDKPRAEPGERFVYSDINFILLGEIVRRVSGQPLPEFVRASVFEPLGMKESMFQPPASLRPRIAPTEGQWGVVHDPTTRFMGGIAGHAGLFSTADDLARFAQMMLNRGELNGTRVLSPLTIEKFTTPQSPPDQSILRGFGWDIDSPFSGPRGELFPLGSYGHTGFTGTSMWIDPGTQTYIVLLTNSGHPRLRPVITPLRARVATITAAALGIDVPGMRITAYNETLTSAGVRREIARNGQVLTGLDVLAQDRFGVLQGKKVGLITNQTGLDREGRRNIDLMRAAGVNLVALFSPEHGMSGLEDSENVGNTKDATGTKVWSLYSGPNRRPSEEMLRGVDTLVFDIQDIGARYYTYVSTLAYAMEEAAKRRIPIWVLDRPNPITGVRVEGPMIDRENLSFIGYFPMPLRHGMTAGELARMFNAENRIGADLHVISMKNWQRGDWFDSTGLAWTNPSPNMRSLTAAVLYPAVAMLENSNNYSVGRGTDTPLEQIGADFIRGRELAAHLNQRLIPGLRAYPVRFRPASSHFASRTIDGVRLIVTNREAFSSLRAGVEIAAALERLYPGKLDFTANRRLIGSEFVVGALRSGVDPRQIVQRCEEDVEPFLEMRRKYLLY